MVVADPCCLRQIYELTLLNTFSKIRISFRPYLNSIDIADKIYRHNRETIHLMCKEKHHNPSFHDILVPTSYFL
jgi:hypothetical protein